MTARVNDCGCGLWLCRECRPENFDPDHPLNRVDVKARLAALEAAARAPAPSGEER